MIDEHILTTLRKYTTHQRLLGLAIEGFRACFANHDGCIDGHRADDFELVFRAHSLVFEATWIPRVDTYLVLFEKADRECSIQAGNHRLETSLAG